METRNWAGRHVPALTAALTLVSLALVFGAALQVLPVGALPAPEGLLHVIPHVNAVVSATAIVTISSGFAAIRKGYVGTHRVLMLASFVLFGLFLGLYLYRVAILGPTEFPGPETIRTYVYLPVLVVHISLAIVCVPFVFHALLLGETRPVPEIYQTRHARVGQIAVVLWLVSFSMGIVIYSLLYHVY